MLIEIEHKLHFRYDDFIQESFMELRVEPVTDRYQTLRTFYLAVGPPTQVARYTDWNDNFVHHFGVTEYHDRVEILARAAVSTEAPPIRLAEVAPTEGAGSSLGSLIDFTAFGGPVQKTSDLERLAADLAQDGSSPSGEEISELGRFLLSRFEYRKGVTDYRSSLQTMLDEGGGVCQDFAHLALGLLRLRGVPCRYVSGYLHVESGGGEPSQSHAWIEVYVSGHGWIPFDPTHDQVPDERYVVVARGRHYDDVPPNRGIYRGAASERLEASVATRVASPKAVASLQEEIGRLDVPVFRDQPRSAPAAPDDLDAQQQQQQ